MPENTVKVDRSTRFGNPYRIGAPVDAALVQRWGWQFSPSGLLHVCENADEAVSRFEHCLLWDEAIHDFVRKQLGGRNLACWCPHDQACHRDSLLWLANSTPAQVHALHKVIDDEIMAGRAEPSIAELRRSLAHAN